MMTTLLLQIERDHSPAYCALLCSYVRIARQTGALRTATLSSQSLVHCDRAGARVVCVSARDSMCSCAHGDASEARSRSPTAGPRGRQSRRHGTQTQACTLLRRTLPSRRSQACGVGRCQGGGRAGGSEPCRARADRCRRFERDCSSEVPGERAGRASRSGIVRRAFTPLRRYGWWPRSQNRDPRLGRLAEWSTVDALRSRPLRQPCPV